MESKDNVLLRRPAVTTAILITTFLVPVVVLPYALIRRRIFHLTQQMDHLVTANADLQNVVSKSARDIALSQEELARTTSLVERSKNELSLLRRDVSQTQALLSSNQSATRAELQTLLNEGKLTRPRLDLLPSLGLSLADIAAFMHQVELHQSLPSSTVHNHGIERLRTLALKFQISPTLHKVDHFTTALQGTDLIREVLISPQQVAKNFAFSGSKHHCRLYAIDIVHL